MWLVTSTGTDAGKTFVTVALVRALRERNVHVAAVKPFETGVGPRGPRDAIAIAAAAGDRSLAHLPELVRAKAPLAPIVAVRGGVPTSALHRIGRRLRSVAREHDVTVIEGAGGLFVPLRRAVTFATLAKTWDAKVLVVIPNALGVLSHTIALAEAARAARLRVHAYVLNAVTRQGDESTRTNARVLGEWLDAPIFSVAHSGGVPRALVDLVAR